jgi:hypothetical protein
MGNRVSEESSGTAVLKEEALYSFETFISTYKTTQYHNPEDHSLVPRSVFKYVVITSWSSILYAESSGFELKRVGHVVTVEFH